MNRERLDKQIEFILEVDKEKNIVRQTPLTNNGRQENDAEHAWHMALMVYLLKEYSNEDFDVAKAMIMALIHDIVEIDAGDTFAYDEKGLQTKQEREEKALERIFSLLPYDQKNELQDLFIEFEEGKTPEAKFVKVIDNFQPFLLNDSNEGIFWKDKQIKKSQILKRQNKTILGSKKIWEYIEDKIDENVKKGTIIDE